VVEVTDGSGHDAPFIGVAALDAAAGHVLLGSWRDDEVRHASSLQAVMLLRRGCVLGFMLDLTCWHDPTCVPEYVRHASTQDMQMTLPLERSLL
jgi:hypothetical protein